MGAVDAEGGELAVCGSGVAEMAGDAGGLGVELGVGPGGVFKLDGDGGGGAGGLGFDEAVHGGGGEGDGAVVPGVEKLVALGGGEEREIAEGGVRGVADGLEEGAPVAEEPLDGGGVEEVAGVEDAAADVGGVLVGFEIDVELGGACVDVDGHDLPAGGCGVHRWEIGEEDLEDRVAAASRLCRRPGRRARRGPRRR